MKNGTVSLRAMEPGDAEQVLLTGCSAGGLATFLHTDYVHSRLKAVATGLTK